MTNHPDLECVINKVNFVLTPMANTLAVQSFKDGIEQSNGRLNPLHAIQLCLMAIEHYSNYKDIHHPIHNPNHLTGFDAGHSGSEESLHFTFHLTYRGNPVFAPNVSVVGNPATMVEKLKRFLDYLRLHFNKPDYLIDRWLELFKDRHPNHIKLPNGIFWENVKSEYPRGLVAVPLYSAMVGEYTSLDTLSKALESEYKSLMNVDRVDRPITFTNLELIERLLEMEKTDTPSFWAVVPIYSDYYHVTFNKGEVDVICASTMFSIVN